MWKRLTGAALVVVALTEPGFAWGKDTFVERAATVSAGRTLCRIPNRSRYNRYLELAGFFTRQQPKAVASRVEKRAEILVRRLSTPAAVAGFCRRIAVKDF